jgi:hypothetical protein
MVEQSIDWIQCSLSTRLMAATFQRDQQSRRVSVGSLLALAVTCAAMLGCREQHETSATVNSATASLDSAGSAAVQAQTQDKVLRSGEFVDGEHPTSGGARLVERNGAIRLELDEAFTTSTSGPDLVVALHRSADVIGSTTPPAFPIREGDYVVLAPLESYVGSQSYAVHQEIQTEDFASAVIWCRRFNATFGAARLDPQP